MSNVVFEAPNPQPLDDLLTADGVAEYKRTDCRRYSTCLDVASDAGWQQFHCNACNAYIAIPDDDPSNAPFARLGKKLIDLKKKRNGHNP